MVTGWPSRHQVSHLHMARNIIHSLRLDMLPAQKNLARKTWECGSGSGGEESEE